MKRWQGVFILVVITFSAMGYVIAPLFTQKSISTTGIVLRGDADYDITSDQEGESSITEFPMGNIRVGEPVEEVFWIQNHGSDMMLTIELSEPNWDASDDDVIIRWESPEDAVLIPANSAVELKLWITITRSLPNAFDGSKNFRFLIIFNGNLL